MQDLEVPSAHYLNEVSELPEAVDYTGGLARQQSLRERIAKLPRRFDLRDFIATCIEVFLWVWVVSTFPLYFFDPYTPSAGSPLYYKFLYGFLSFVAVGYGSFLAYRFALRKALYNSNLNLQFASGFVEGTQAATVKNLLDVSDPAGQTIERLLHEVASHPRRYFSFRTFLFSPVWMTIYYSGAIIWTIWCLGPLMGLDEVVFPHFPFLELALPPILFTHLRKVRLQEVCGYLQRMLRG